MKNVFLQAFSPFLLLRLLSQMNCLLRVRHMLVTKAKR